MKRKIIISAVAAGILALGMLGKNALSGARKPLPKAAPAREVSAYTTEVINGTLATEVSGTGRLIALNRIEMYAEVQGIILPDGGKFRTAQEYSRGEALITLESADFQAGLAARRSMFRAKLVSLLPDLKADFAPSYSAWSAYAKNVSPSTPLQDLPDFTDEQINFFITGRGIQAEWYEIKNAELTLAKYAIKAPYNGVVTEALVTPGTVVRPGQKLGEFVDPSRFELEIAVGSSALNLRPGTRADVFLTEDGSSPIQGKVTRVNKSVDPGTQTVGVFIEVSGLGTEEGKYAEARISGPEITDAFELPRPILNTDNTVFIVVDSVLMPVQTSPVFYKPNTVLVRGLPEGARVIIKPVPGAYAGMKVAEITEFESK